MPTHTTTIKEIVILTTFYFPKNTNNQEKIIEQKKNITCSLEYDFPSDVLINISFDNFIKC